MQLLIFLLAGGYTSTGSYLDKFTIMRLHLNLDWKVKTLRHCKALIERTLIRNCAHIKCLNHSKVYGLEHSNGGLITFPGGVPLLDKEGVFIGSIGVRLVRAIPFILKKYSRNPLQ